MTTTPNSTQRSRRQQHKATDVNFEINLVDGAEAERLGRQQAAVIRDVLLWHHQDRNSAPPDASIT
ncbi:hypothetical protein QRX60_17770 [Amycolatopsis mongoliensis]|uniref:Uncharacterized protein n=1 Tax=Amycolatopsis mongoliensis TaxID=715475 RepID=A0A9Y2JX66_9PSEU|nr:hypothetical protein [Amycolatopsis sp. 4-36]WIY05605.1 hypothetical protein QRX60_17770 [Amycolatopsis sp. 4-36]